MTDHEANTNLVTIPTMAVRVGDLSASKTTIYNPFSGNPDGTGRQQIVASSAHLSAIELSEEIVARVRWWCGDTAQQDDLTLVVMKVK